MPGQALAGWLAGRAPGSLGERCGVRDGAGQASWHPPPHRGCSRPPAPGCVRELRIQGEEIVFHDLNLTAHGISHCPTCRDRPCQVTPHRTHRLTAGAAPWEVGESRGVLCLTSGGGFTERGPVSGFGEQQLCVCLPGRLHREPLRALPGPALPPRCVTPPSDRRHPRALASARSLPSIPTHPTADRTHHTVSTRPSSQILTSVPATLTPTLLPKFSPRPWCPATHPTPVTAARQPTPPNTPSTYHLPISHQGTQTVTCLPGTQHPTLFPHHSCTSLPCCPPPSLLGAPLPCCHPFLLPSPLMQSFQAG